MLCLGFFALVHPQQCHLSYLVELTSSGVYVSGPENIVADALSRPSSISSPSASALVFLLSPSQLSLAFSLPPSMFL